MRLLPMVLRVSGKFTKVLLRGFADRFFRLTYGNRILKFSQRSYKEIVVSPVEHNLTKRKKGRVNTT